MAMFGGINIVLLTWSSCLLLVIASDLLTGKIAEKDAIQIKVANGIIQGTLAALEKGQYYYNFQGIPFAQPPIGNLRFKDPVPYKKWNGVLNATKFGPSCVEITLRQVTYKVIGEENCLYLNVYSPQNPYTIISLLPVLVWIYGGSFREGSSNLYNPEYFMKQNVILVTFNYRMGIFGFLSTQDPNSPGNYGMKDMVMALKWVKTNIAQFGGDPNKITIFGESAGAASVGYLMLSKMSKDLFSAAVMQSGSPLCNWALHRNARKVAFDLGISVGITTNSTDNLMRYLRKIDFVKRGQSMIDVNFLNFIGSFTNGGPFGPVIEQEGRDAFFTKDSYKAMKNGDFHKVPVIIGLNSQEAKFFNALLPISRSIFFLYDVSPSSLVRPAMNVKSVRDRRSVGTKIRQFYTGTRGFVRSEDAQLAEFFSDDLFVRPITKTAQLLSRHVPVYFYVFDYEGDIGKEWLEFASEVNNNVKGVAHATDLWYLWKAKWTETGLRTEDDALISKRLVKLWSNFATYREPTPIIDKLLNNATWPKVSGRDIDFFYIGKNIETRKNFKERSINFWNSLYAEYSNGPFETY